MSSLPKYYGFYTPFLTALQDQKVHTSKEIQADIAQMLNLSDEQLSEVLPSGTQSVFCNHIGWAKTYLKKAGLIESSKKGCYSISAEGLSLLHSGVTITDTLLAQRYPSFAAFKYGERKKSSPEITSAETSIHAEETPPETLDRVYRDINNKLADDLLSEIMNQSPAFFEHLVVDLMQAMNYGEGTVTQLSGDGGIDGIIHEDRLGFSQIYIQAKRHDPSSSIHTPEVQKFVGAMMGPPRVEKGLFITTAKFSQGAIRYANAQHIILVDGKKLTSLMIEYGLGVSVQKVYKLKRIDSDYFAEEI